MSEKIIDCLLIGHNEMDFTRYEETTRKMGLHSGAYRDLELSFIRYNGNPYTAIQAFNLFCCPDEETTGVSIKKIRWGETFSATIAYLATYLDKHGLTFDYVMSFHEQKEELKEKLLRENIRAIAVTTTFYVAVLPIVDIIEFIKKYNQTAKIVIGGPFISSQVRAQEPMVVRYLLESIIGADIYVNSSQGEASLVKILQALKNNQSLEHVKNLFYRTDNKADRDGNYGNDGNNGDYVFTTIEPENNRLSENMVNWNLFNHDIGEFVNSRTSISCPFSCAFCGFPEHAGKFQTADVEKVEEELNQLQGLEKVKSIHFIDDTFNLPVKRFKTLLKKMIKNRYTFKWHSHFRCQYMDEETVELMKESGCEGVFLGIESGDDQILKNMNKAASVEDYLKGIQYLKEYGIVTHGSFIIGFPGETHETVKNTIRFIEESELDFYQVQAWYCEPITPIWRQKEKYGLSGESFEWKHHTMDSKTAFDFVEDIFLSVEKSIYVPRYSFDFDSIFHFIHRGLSMAQAGKFLRTFNRAIKSKLQNPLQKEISLQAVKEFQKILS